MNDTRNPLPVSWDEAKGVIGLEFGLTGKEIDDFVLGFMMGLAEDARQGFRAFQMDKSNALREYDLQGYARAIREKHRKK